MLRRLLLNRMTPNWPISIQKCRLSSEKNHQIAMMTLLGNMWRSKIPNKEHREAIPDGSSRYWELGNPNDLNVCVGGTGPIVLEDNIKVSELIDFQNKKFDKLHIEMLDCPKLLATKFLRAFPRTSVQSESLRIIKLSYHKYRDQNKGKLDCLIAANLLCKRLYEEGDFGFYSGAFTQNANDELLFYNRGVPVEINGEIHSTVRLINGYLHINQLGENDVGIVYTDCEANTLHELRKWIDG